MASNGRFTHKIRFAHTRNKCIAHYCPHKTTIADFDRFCCAGHVVYMCTVYVFCVGNIACWKGYHFLISTKILPNCQQKPAQLLLFLNSQKPSGTIFLIKTACFGSFLFCPKCQLWIFAKCGNMWTFYDYPRVLSAEYRGHSLYLMTLVSGGIYKPAWFH